MGRTLLCEVIRTPHLDHHYIKVLIDNNGAKVETYSLCEKLLEDDNPINKEIITLLNKYKEKKGGSYTKYINKYSSLKKYFNSINNIHSHQ